MAKRLKDGVELIKTLTGKGRGGSRPKPPKAVAQRASLEAPGAVSEHQTAKRRLTAKTVALDCYVAAERTAAGARPEGIGTTRALPWADR